MLVQESGSETEKVRQRTQGVLIDQVPLWATGLLSHREPVATDVKYGFDLSHSRGRELGYKPSISHLSFIYNSHPGSTSPNLYPGLASLQSRESPQPLTAEHRGSMCTEGPMSRGEELSIPQAVACPTLSCWPASQQEGFLCLLCG